MPNRPDAGPDLEGCPSPVIMLLTAAASSAAQDQGPVYTASPYPTVALPPSLPEGPQPALDPKDKLQEA